MKASCIAAQPVAAHIVWFFALHSDLKTQRNLVTYLQAVHPSWILRYLKPFSLLFLY